MGQCCSDSVKEVDGQVIVVKESDLADDQQSEEQQKKASSLGDSGNKSSSQSNNNKPSSASKALIKSRCSVTSDRISQRKLAYGLGPKVKVDIKKIMESIREKQSLRSDVALIGTGGRQVQSADVVKSTSKSAHLKSVQSGHARKSEKSEQKSTKNEQQ